MPYCPTCRREIPAPVCPACGAETAGVQIISDHMIVKLTPAVMIEFVRVPAGEFLMGSDSSLDPDAREPEMPQHRVYLDEYWMGKHPVTNEQYQVFVEATEREVPVHWNNGCAPAGKEAHPVVFVAWHDAMAFCEWIGKLTNVDAHLPSEAEWEKAARGTDGCIYPWGNEKPNQSRCNTGKDPDRTTPAGHYSPLGDSPCGCADMAGNVWEWTRSVWGREWDAPAFHYPYDAADGRERTDPDDDLHRVLRGGSFHGEAVDVRCVGRGRLMPDYRYWDVGLRAVY